jgi:hypothetical protein
MPAPSDEVLVEILTAAKTVAVVGLSNNPTRASLGVSRFLQRHGYRIFPVHPTETEVLGEHVYRSLSEVPDPVDIVNIFVRSELVPPIVEEAIAKTPRCIWMQEEVFHPEAAARAEAAGIPVVMGLCILKESARLLPPLARPR